MLLQEITKEIKKIQAELNEMIVKQTQIGLEEIARVYPDIRILCVYGYTPGFNDGEPCEHSTELVDSYEDADYYGLQSEIDGLLTDEQIEYVQKQKETKLPHEITDFFRTSVIPYLDNEFDTNYIVVYLFQDGIVTRYNGDYDCGY